jgi:catechol 2,3-dioxygenase-like lactoylglutathione lyase family enzyme
MRWLFLIAAMAAPLSAQLPAPNESGVSMGHIHLMVADPEEQKKLWVGVLGAEVTHTGSLELLKLPGIFMIVQKARTPPAEGSEGSTVNHIGFLVKSYAEMKAKLTAAKLELVTDNANTKQLMVTFPDKVKVEFTEDAALKVPIALHHIHISATDPEKLRAWYVKTFGAKAGTRGAFLAAMIPGGEVDFRKAQQAEAPTKGRSLDHIGFEVKNLEAFCQKLQADGITLETAYRDILPHRSGGHSHRVDRRPRGALTAIVTRSSHPGRRGNKLPACRPCNSRRSGSHQRGRGHYEESQWCPE